MKEQILIINDDKVETAALNRVLSEEYSCVLAMNVKDAIRSLEKSEHDFLVIIIRLAMKPMSGLRFVEILSENKKIDTLPIIVTSETEDDGDLERCFELGVVDYMSKPFDPQRIRRCISRNIRTFNKFRRLGEQIEEKNSSLKEDYAELEKQNSDLKEAQTTVLEILGTVVEYRNLEDSNHVRRVARFTEILGKQMKQSFSDTGLDDHTIKVYTKASMLHDIGKICIPDSIMLKPGKMTDDEFEIMRSHTTKGIELLESIKTSWDDEYGKAAEEICRWHHERYDGRGYPDGLMGDDIPISAQLVSIADTYDALVSDRVYKKAYSKSEAFKMITEGECGVFSPKLVEAFRQARVQFEKVVDELGHVGASDEDEDK